MGRAMRTHGEGQDFLADPAQVFPGQGQIKHEQFEIERLWEPAPLDRAGSAKPSSCLLTCTGDIGAPIGLVFRCQAAGWGQMWLMWFGV